MSGVEDGTEWAETQRKLQLAENPLTDWDKPQDHEDIIGGLMDWFDNLDPTGMHRTALTKAGESWTPGARPRRDENDGSDGDDQGDTGEEETVLEPDNSDVADPDSELDESEGE